MLVRVKERHQVTLPTSLRRAAQITVGDVLDVSVKNGVITLRAQQLVDREIALALKEVREGKTKTFKSMEDLIASLHKSAARQRRSPASRPRRKHARR